MVKSIVKVFEHKASSWKMSYVQHLECYPANTWMVWSAGNPVHRKKEQRMSMLQEKKSNLTRNVQSWSRCWKGCGYTTHSCLQLNNFLTLLTSLGGRERERKRVWCCACYWLPLAHSMAGLTLGHGPSLLQGSGLQFGPTEPPNFGIRPRRYFINQQYLGLIY